MVWNYIFSIYEIDYKVNPNFLVADGSSICEIVIVPVNSFGWKAPFRNVEVNYQIVEGSRLIEIVESDKTGTIKIKAKDKPGKVLLKVNSKYSKYPFNVSVQIKPKLAQNNREML